MKVLHLDSGADWRGGQQQVLYLAAGLAQRGVEQQLAVRQGGALSHRVAQARLTFSQLPFRSEADLSSILRLRQLIKRFRPDIIHAHDARTLGLAAASRMFGSKAKLVAARRVAFPVGKNPFSRLKYGTVDRILAVSEFIRASLKASGIDSRRVAVIYDGFDRQQESGEVDRFSLRQRFRIPDGACLIGSVGRFTAEKGHDVLIRGFHRVHHVLSEALLLLIGDGELRDVYQRLARDLGLEGKVLFPGFVSDVSAVLPALDLFVFPSRQEGLGSILLAAMALGVPVCASRTGGIPEVVEDRQTGCLFPPEDPDSLADAVLLAIRSPVETQRWAKAAIRSVQEKFSVGRMVEQTYQVYSNVLAS